MSLTSLPISRSSARIETADTRKDRVICVYCDNSWDKEAVGRVFKVLVQDLSLVSGAYKASLGPDAYI